MQLFLWLLHYSLPSSLLYLSLYFPPLFSSYFLHLPTRFNFSQIASNDRSRSRRLLVKVRSVKLKLSAFGVSPTDEGMSRSCSFVIPLAAPLILQIPLNSVCICISSLHLSALLPSFVYLFYPSLCSPLLSCDLLSSPFFIFFVCSLLLTTLLHWSTSHYIDNNLYICNCSLKFLIWLYSLIVVCWFFL